MVHLGDDMGDERGKFEIHKEPNGQYFWRLRAADGRVLSLSARGYENKDTLLKDIVMVKQNTEGAEIINKY